MNFGTDTLLLMAAVLVTLVILLGLVYFLLFFRRSINNTRDTMRALNMAVVRINFSERAGRGAFAKELVLLTEKLFKLLSGIRSRGRFVDRLIFEEPYVAFEMMNVGLGTQFYVAFPRLLENQIVKYIYSIFPGVEVSRATDQNPFFANGRAVFSTLGLSRPPTIPLPTFDMWDGDPLAQLLAVFEEVKLDERAAFQVLIRPAPVDWNEKAIHEVESKAMAPDTQRWDVHFIERLRDKASRPVFFTNIRLTASARQEKRAYELLAKLERALGSVTVPDMNQLESYEIIREDAVFNFALRLFNSALAVPLSTRELASIYHFTYAGGAAASTPAEAAGQKLPDFAPTEESDIVLGTLMGVGDAKVRFLSALDRFSHFYSVGQTGTGKSALFAEMIRQDLERGRGAAVIDPHGDLIETVLRNIPAKRVEDVILFDPADTERPFGLNMLEFSDENERDQIVQEMIVIFEKLFPKEFVGPVFEHNMRHALLTLMARADPVGTLVEVPRLLTDEIFAKRYVSQLTDPLVRDYWQKERPRLSAADQAEVLQYIISKLGRFIENRLMRNILGQRRSSFNVGEIISEGKIFLANLAKGKLGELNAALLGLIIVSKIQIAALKQAELPPEKRRHFFLYMDEFQNFTTDNIAVILSEGRKYGLSLNVTHQFIGQLKGVIQEAVFGNVGTLVVFRIGAPDAEFFSHEFAPLGNVYDFVNMGNYEAFGRLMAQGKRTPPFMMHTNPPAPGDEALAEALKKASRLKYGRPHAAVERAMFSL